jgi:hypothetical protein
MAFGPVLKRLSYLEKYDLDLDIPGLQVKHYSGGIITFDCKI